jgi:DNA-binding Lrp family transcriptional regulator
LEELLKKLFDEKTVKIISYIQKKKSLHIRETARETGLPITTVFRIFKKLESFELIKSMEVGAFKIYNVNRESRFFPYLEKLVPQMKPIEQFIKSACYEKVEQILLLDDGENRSSIMVVGDAKTAKIQEIAEEIKTNFGHSIKVLVLSKSQYDNLEALNMKPTPKKVLFTKS